MLLSIVVPVFNTEKFLPNCLDSIKNQQFSDFEVILVDDGSTDKSSTICDKYAEIDDRFTVYHRKNNGVSAARNYGISCAKGDYITFVDSDDYIFPFYFKEIRKIISESSPDVVVTSGYYWGNEKKSNVVKLNIPHDISTDDNSFYRLLADRVYPSGLVFSVFKRSIAQQIELDESIYFYEDLDYQLRAGSYIKHISVNDCIGYLYREGSQTHCKFTDKTMSCFSIIKKMENNDVSLDKNLIARFKYNFLISNALIAAKDKKHEKGLDYSLREQARLFCTSKEWITTFRIPYIWIAVIAISPRLYYKLYRLKHNNL